MKPAIVIVAYNRPTALQRLLSTVESAFFDSDDIPLIISVDYSSSKENGQVVQIANNFRWLHGEKTVIRHEENFGLRKHILSCGDLSKKYGAVLLLEDDLRVSPGFYEYASAAARIYRNELQIAGISLYAYEYEEFKKNRFYPKNNGGDTYFMQWAASWGQLWTKNQWSGFRDWYQEGLNIDHINMLDWVKDWSSSWKKYYIAYMVEKDLYMAYPYISYTSVKDGMGVHNLVETRTNNVNLVGSAAKREFEFSNFDEEDLRYDSFFQPVNKKFFSSVYKKEIEVEFDFFGTKKLKNVTAPHLFTTKKGTKILESYSNQLIPYEHNLYQVEHGDYFNLGRSEDFKEYADLLHQGNKLYHGRKVFLVKEMLIVLVYRLLFKTVPRWFRPKK